MHAIKDGLLVVKPPAVKPEWGRSIGFFTHAMIVRTDGDNFEYAGALQIFESPEAVTIWDRLGQEFATFGKAEWMLIWALNAEGVLGVRVVDEDPNQPPGSVG